MEIRSSNSQSPNFGELRVHESYKKLGSQGQKTLEIISPIAEQLTDGFVTTIGAAPNPSIGNKYSLMILVQGQEEKPKGLLGKFQKALRPSCIHQSSTDAVSPDLLVQNIIIPQESVGESEGKTLSGLYKLADEFFLKPETAAKVDAYENSYSKVPTWDDLDTDAIHGTDIARENGYNCSNPFEKS